jgi:hypothetical protein
MLDQTLLEPRPFERSKTQHKPLPERHWTGEEMKRIRQRREADLVMSAL